MWYFAWILGTALAVSFGILNALWYESHIDSKALKEKAEEVF